jgi:hypothetical protein
MGQSGSQQAPRIAIVPAGFMGPTTSGVPQNEWGKTVWSNWATLADMFQGRR